MSWAARPLGNPQIISFLMSTDFLNPDTDAYWAQNPGFPSATIGSVNPELVYNGWRGVHVPGVGVMSKCIGYFDVNTPTFSFAIPSMPGGVDVGAGAILKISFNGQTGYLTSGTNSNDIGTFVNSRYWYPTLPAGMGSGPYRVEIVTR